MATDDSQPPATCNGNLAKLPRALVPLIARPQWAIWRWTARPKGGWQKPPFMATQPSRHVSTSDPDTWTDYGTALAAVHAGHGNGISYILTEDDPFAAIDLDNCRHIDTHSIDIWAQNFLDCGRKTYSEITPSGSGCRIWGLADGAKLNRKFNLNIDGKDIAAELFRRAPKALTITGYRLDTIRELTNIDRVLDWAIVWGERRKAAAAKTATPINSFGGHGNGCSYSIDQIEQIVRTGAPGGEDRSAVFHTIVGHYLGCGWTAEQIITHLAQYPDGIAARYIHEDRLTNEVWRSAGKYGVAEPIEAKAPLPKQPEPKPEPQADPELDDDVDADEDDTDDDDDAGKASSTTGTAGPELDSVRASSVVMTAIDWFWPNRFALGKIGIIAALPDEGKGQVFFYMAAQGTNDGVWPCNEGRTPQGNVILLTAEDDLGDTVVPRLKAAGADLNRVEIVKMVRTGDSRRMFSLATDLDLLRKKIIEVGNVNLIGIDPVSSYLGVGKINSFRTTDVRAVLAPLMDLAVEFKICIVLIMHFNKKTDVTNALLRISDSLAFGAVARHVYGVVCDAENDRQLFVKAKNNLAKKSSNNTLAYRFETRQVGIDPRNGKPIQPSYIVWEPQYVDVTALEAMQAAADQKSPAARDSAEKFLRDQLAKGPVLKTEIEEAAEANCITDRTLRRAKEALKVVAKKSGLKAGWTWELPK